MTRPLLCPHCGSIDPHAVAELVQETQRPRLAPEPEKLCVSLRRAAELADVGLTTINGWISRGILPTVQTEKGGKHLVMVRDLESALLNYRTGGKAWHEDEPKDFPEPKTRGRQLKPLSGGRP